MPLDPLAPARGLASPLAPRLVGAEVVPPRSALPDGGFCSHAPNARATATARIPIISLGFIAFSRVVWWRPRLFPPGAFGTGDDAGPSAEVLTARRQQGRR